MQAAISTRAILTEAQLADKECHHAGGKCFPFSESHKAAVANELATSIGDAVAEGHARRTQPYFK